MPESLSARTVVRRLLGDAPLAGWSITDVRASSGIRVTLARAAGEPLHDAVILLRSAGLPGFIATPRMSVALLGSPTPAHAPLLAAVSARIESGLPAFAAGEIEAAVENAVLRLTPIQTTRIEGRAHRPKEVELRLNLNCNQACFFCNCDGFAPNTVPVASVAVEAAGRLGSQGVETVVITGGEPTLHQVLFDVARAAREGGVRQIVVQTNAVKLGEPGFAASLRAAGVTTMFVSLHSRTADVSDRITCTDATHALTLTGIDAGLDAGMNVITNFVINRLNMTEPPSFVEWLRKRFDGRISGRVFSFMSPVAAALNNLTLIPRMSEAAGPLRAALDDCDRAGEWIKVAGVCGLPLCVLAGYERFSDERENPPDVPLADDRTKLPTCAECTHERRCSGIWKRYLDLYGPAEFVPVR
jgi:pyruvate-formate lyase-activating enzyme